MDEISLDEILNADTFEKISNRQLHLLEPAEPWAWQISTLEEKVSKVKSPCDYRLET